jgi:D-cysteine desulfhydrase family pyridoxal phosphate-dependent enzyme
MSSPIPSRLTAHLPRVALAQLPTPLEALARLREALPGSPRLLIKRDDQTGLATGGNKTRKLEFLAADALAQSKDTLITVGGAQSNHCRQTAAAAARLGLDCALVLSGDPVPREAWQGNLLLDDLLSAEVHWTHGRPRDKVTAEVARDFESQGKRPYVIPTGGSVPIGAAGYVAAVEELAAQLAQQGKHATRIVLVSGSGGTHAGVLVGVKALGLDLQVEGMNNFAIEDVAATVRRLSAETAAFLGLDLTFTDEDVRCFPAAGTHPYGTITAVERDAIRLLGRTEGILLDPIYTARAFAQMVAHIQAGAYDPDETLVFWHTGGAAGLFPRAEDLMAGAD